MEIEILSAPGALPSLKLFVIEKSSIDMKLLEQISSSARMMSCLRIL